MLSTCEAEYVVLAHAVKEALWLRTVLASLQMLPPGPTTVFKDNNGARSLDLNPNSHARSKNIDIRYHFTRHKVSGVLVASVAKRTSDMLADLGTAAGAGGAPLLLARHGFEGAITGGSKGTEWLSALSFCASRRVDAPGQS